VCANAVVNHIGAQVGGLGKATQVNANRRGNLISTISDRDRDVPRQYHGL